MAFPTCSRLTTNIINAISTTFTFRHVNKHDLTSTYFMSKQLENSALKKLQIIVLISLFLTVMLTS